MPELPEVETIRQDLQLSLSGTEILSIDVPDPTVLTGFLPNGKPRWNVSVRDFSTPVLNKKLTHFYRRGKYLIAELEPPAAILLHLRMTGQLLLGNPDSYVRLSFKLSNNKSLHFSDRRRFGEIRYVTDWQKDPTILKLGIEPLQGQLTPMKLKNLFKNRKASIHSLLLNQKMISGLGNIYAAEALYLAGIKPQRRASRIRRHELERLSQTITQVIQDSIHHRGYSMATYVDLLGQKGKSQLFSKVYGKESQPCAVCRKPLKKTKLAGRSAVYCPNCQK